MRLILLLTAALALAACSIKSNRPDYQYPNGSDATGADWPELAVTSELAAAGQGVTQTAKDNQAATERLAVRARALRARAARLQRDVAN
ncbi:hypothetical protein [Neptunicoccus cionae]|uniref:Uncharacterized protein n=1 Tax=Neptunicoccus cionae TaxID=2035344 RepID=A0A916QVH9_9RHOB|nr:hypothetical protein [Amylibacter cionae]GGA14025.1 hypothetical protein GCM10011498_12650 [Amylibacter cionae]